jgi:DNA-binding NarL/FixJ family response regulator
MAARTQARYKEGMQTQVPPLRILLVDDSPVFLGAAIAALSADPRLEVIGSAVSGPEGIELVHHRQPDVVLMDLAMPGMNGMEATRRLKAQPAAPCVIVLTSHELPRYRLAAHAAGADGFICKANFDAELFPFLEALLVERSAPVS